MEKAAVEVEATAEDGTAGADARHRAQTEACKDDLRKVMLDDVGLTRSHEIHVR